jgi:hypothetical protein
VKAQGLSGGCVDKEDETSYFFDLFKFFNVERLFEIFNSLALIVKSLSAFSRTKLASWIVWHKWLTAL